jgi:DNA-binding transcriptional ArsR family regulator
MEKFNSNSFAPFLDAVKQSETRGAGSDRAPLRILRKLADSSDKRMEVGSLMSASELPFGVFSDALRAFEEAGLIRTTRAGTQQVAVLQPAGEKLLDVTL